MAYIRQSKSEGRKVASTIYLRERKDRAARVIARKENRSKSAVIVKIVEDALP